MTIADSDHLFLHHKRDGAFLDEVNGMRIAPYLADDDRRTEAANENVQREHREVRKTLADRSNQQCPDTPAGEERIGGRRELPRCLSGEVATRLHLQDDDW